MQYRLGKKAPRIDKRTLKFANYLTPQLPAPPTSAEWQSKVPSWGMDGNDSVGDCTVAAAAHLMEAWTYNSGQTPVVMSTADCENDYFALTGGQDTGLDLLTVLNQWRTGLAYGSKKDVIGAFAALTPGNQYEAQQTVALFCGGYIGLQLPNFIVNSLDPFATPWVVPPGGAVGPNAPNPNNGHCVPIVGYDANYLYIVTWGAVVQMGYDFYAAYSDEGFAVLSGDWIESGGEAPSGFNMTQLQTDLTEVTQTPPPNPPPTPSPPAPTIWQEIVSFFEWLWRLLTTGNPASNK